MKFQFTEQGFQTAAINAVCDVFKGQVNPFSEFNLTRDDEIVIGANAEISLSDDELLKNLRGVQSQNGLPIKPQLDGKNFTVEMETGTGKTYTYIKTMYELNRRYGWKKFMVIVPSVAIREGVKKTFEVTAEHFKDKYNGEQIRYFVYSSQRLEQVKNFVRGAGIWAMIVNVQAFNSKAKDLIMLQEARDDFGSLAPIEAIAQIRPIIIIDEPQSVEGATATEQIPKFNPLMILRYSATHKNLFNLVYKLDALDAYRQRLVKKIAIKGIEVKNDKSAGFIFLERINLSKNNPTAKVTFRHKGATNTNRITRKISEGDDLYRLSNGLDEYKNNFIVAAIDGADNSLKFRNGQKIFVGQAIGDVNDEAVKRIQIRETIQSHLEREAELFRQGIKVLSLFFIDKVEKYRSDDGQGFYEKIFEEEYAAAVDNFKAGDADYQKYLASISAHETHAGYFSVDKKNRPINSERDSDNVDTYDLIMRNKERLLDLREPVRFIFSHSALKEGWDNPNVFQICALKHGDENSNRNSSETRRRQEVGRGMRLCVNQNGERQDDCDKNILTVIANESFATFAAGLQKEIAEAVNRTVTEIDDKFFVGKKLAGRNVDQNLAIDIYEALIECRYVKRKQLTGKFFDDKSNGQFSLGKELEIYRKDVLKLLDKVSGDDYEIENACANNIEVVLDKAKFYSENFQELWRRIRQKTFYGVDFDSDEFIGSAVEKLNEQLIVPETEIHIVRGTMNDDGKVTQDPNGLTKQKIITAAPTARVDFIGKLTEATELTRRDAVEILQRIDSKVFDGLEINPEKFLTDAAKIINAVKAEQIAKNIKYTATDEHYDEKIFFGTRTGRLNDNALRTTKNIYSHVIYDSGIEKNFAEELEADANVEVYAKLPREFFITTPIGNYNPDWAIVLHDDEKKFLVVETKGTSDENQLREDEKIKIECAKKHFAALGNEIRYDFGETFEDFLNKISRHKS